MSNITKEKNVKTPQRPDCRKQPLVMRLMMAAVFMPVFMLSLVLIKIVIHLTNSSNLGENNRTFCGINDFWYAVICFVVFPCVGFSLVLGKGWWRIQILLATCGVLLFSVFCMYSVSLPETRKIIITGNQILPDGTDVYCNGVHLGKTPLKITVRDLRKKVPEWNLPPEQKWFLDSKNPVYTWFPWDRFLRERYEEYRLLDQSKSAAPFDRKSKYWWRLEYNGMSYCLLGSISSDGDNAESFDTISSYSWSRQSPHFLQIPARRVVLDILTDSISRLNDAEKLEWAKYIDRLPVDFTSRLHSRSRNNEELKKMLTLAAKVKYGLSETPTAEECRNALEKFISENKDEHLSACTLRYGFGWDGITAIVRGTTNYELQFLAVDAMNNACCKPLQQMFRKNWYAYDSRIAPLLLTAEHHGFSEMFDDLVRFYATSGQTSSAVFNNKNERTEALLQTLLSPRTLYEKTKAGREYAIQDKMSALGCLNNKKLEPLIREYIAKNLSDYDYHYNEQIVEGILRNFVRARIYWKNFDMNELRQWIESLRIRGAVKNKILPMIPLDKEQKENDAVIVKIVGDSGERKITTRALCDWLKERPEKTINDYFEEINPKICEDFDKFDVALLSLEALLNDKSLDAGAVLRKYWDNADWQEKMLNILRERFYYNTSIRYSDGSVQVRNDDDSNARLNGFYYYLRETESKSSAELMGADDPVVFFENENAWNESRGEWARKFLRGMEYNDDGTLKLNAEVFRIFHEVRDVSLCVDFARHLARTKLPESSKFTELLDVWSKSELPKLQKIADDLQNAVKMRDAVREKSKELALQLAAEKITPDDLLPQTAVWVWNNGKYVQKEESIPVIKK
ncbi:MAG: hypothetical protein LBT05_06320 [Planctomycetaceae bacterium]|jgi:hypothetical protein|nr:hypothetical protein [Planctomycetaceae bacterium]